MANKSNQPVQTKKPGKSLKEKRAAKHEKVAEKTAARKAWDK
jgi:hypothetical protein